MTIVECSSAAGLTSGRKSNSYQGSTEGFPAIEAMRGLAKLSQSALCREAGVDVKTYCNIKLGNTQPQRRILIRLSAALDRLAGKTPPPPPEIVAGLYRAALCTFAAELGADVKLALQAKSLSNFDAGNRAAGLARRLAFYVTVNAFDVPRPEVARAVGYTKQAASKALKEIEDARGDNAVLDALILRVGELLTGRDLT